MKSKVALAVALALAILAAVGIRAYLRQEQEKIQGTRKTVPVLFSVKNIQKGKLVTSDMLEVREVDQQLVQDRRPVFPEQMTNILGKPAQKAIAAGEMLFWAYFISETGDENPAATLTPGYRQITIPVDKVTGLAGRLLPGTHVDVLVTLRVRQGDTSSIEPVTQTALTGVQVVATDLNVRRPSEFLSSRERKDFAAYSTVTLKVLPLQAEVLAHLAEQGKIHLVIRSADDPTGRDPSDLPPKVSSDNLDEMIKRAAQEQPPQ